MYRPYPWKKIKAEKAENYGKSEAHKQETYKITQQKFVQTFWLRRRIKV